MFIIRLAMTSNLLSPFRGAPTKNNKSRLFDTFPKKNSIIFNNSYIVLFEFVIYK